MPEAFNIVQYLGIASVYLLHHELKSWCEMSSTFSTWIKAVIMTATTGSPQVIQHLVHNLRLPSSRNQHLRLLTRAQFLLSVTQGCICHLHCHYFWEVILHFEQPLCHLSLFQQLYTLANDSVSSNQFSAAQCHQCRNFLSLISNDKISKSSS